MNGATQRNATADLTKLAAITVQACDAGMTERVIVELVALQGAWAQVDWYPRRADTDVDILARASVPGYSVAVIELDGLSDRLVGIVG